MTGSDMKRVSPILCSFAVILSFFSSVQAQDITVEATPSSSHLVTAEQTIITYRFTGLNRIPKPANFELEGGDMFYMQSSADRINGQTIYYLHYKYQAVREGRHEIPSMIFKSNSGDIRSDKITINVYAKGALSKKTVEVAEQQITYYTLTKATKSSLFPNETTAVEHKVYIPSQLNIALWGLPLGDKENCSAWRFSTPKSRALLSRARIDGKSYQAGSFHSNLTTLKQGNASLGPLKSRVVFHAAVMTGRGLANQQFEVNLTSDKLELNVKPLPSKQPEHFQGDVGSYEMSASIDAPKEILENDSIQIIAQLEGSGNLATVNPPLLLDMEGWKVISESRTDLGEERKSAKGIAEFSYLLQPAKSSSGNNPPTQTPSLFFVVLDPEKGIYSSSRIPGKPIKVSPPQPTEENAQLPYDELINSPSLEAHKLPWYKNLPIWLIHILPLGFVLIICWRQLRSRIHTRRLANSERNVKRQALADLEKVDTLFLKSAGAYVERWVDIEKHPKARDIISLRDSLCFRPESRQDVSAERRRKIISVLRKSSLLLLFTLLIPDSLATTEKIYQQGEVHFEQKDYAAAIASFDSLPHSSQNPDILYNIGLSYQLLGNPGNAAYHYQCALSLDEHHPSAQKNLNYIETENNSITSSNITDIEIWIQTLTPSTYLHTIIFLVSILLCLVLTFVYLKPRATAFRVTIILCIFAPIILSLTIYAYIYHPDRSTHHLETAIMLESATLTSQPLDSSQFIMQAPPASRCHLIAQRGSYSYVIMPNGVKGWARSHLIKTY